MIDTDVLIHAILEIRESADSDGHEEGAVATLLDGLRETTTNEYNPDQPRDDHGRFGSGTASSGTSSTSDKGITDPDTQAKATGLVTSMADKVKARVGTAVKSALTGLDEESKGGVSLIAHGLKGSDPRAVAYGAAQIVGGIFRCVHEEVYENAISAHGGSAIAGKLVAKVLTAGEMAMARGLHKALAAVGLTKNISIDGSLLTLEYTTNANLLDQPLSMVDQALIEVGVTHTIKALTDLYHSAGLPTGAGGIPIPSRDSVRARLLKVLAGAVTDNESADELYLRMRKGLML